MVVLSLDSVAVAGVVRDGVKHLWGSKNSITKRIKKFDLLAWIETRIWLEHIFIVLYE